MKIDENNLDEIVGEFHEAVSRIFEFGKTTLMLTIVTDMEKKFKMLLEENRLEKNTNDYDFMSEKLQENKILSRKYENTIREIDVFYQNYEICCDMFRKKMESE